MLKRPLDYLILGVALLIFAQAASAEKLDDTISYLLNYVATSKATFIRNGTSHTPEQAAAHVKAKYEHFKSEIKTPEDFIRLSASKSLVTGQPYLVRTPEGKEIHLDQWLTEALRAHRSGSTH
jgi:hypothetical protein